MQHERHRRDRDARDRGRKGREDREPPAEPPLDPVERRAVLETLEQAAGAAGLEVLESDLRPNRTLRAVVDADPGPLDTEGMTRFLRDLRRRLETAGVDPGRYAIEVDSPGAHRRLRTRRHFERFAGSRVRVALRGERGGVWTLLGAGTHGPRVRDGEGQERDLDEADVESVRLEP